MDSIIALFTQILDAIKNILGEGSLDGIIEKIKALLGSFTAEAE